MTDQQDAEQLAQLRGATTIVYIGRASREGVCRCGDRIRLGHRIAQMINGSEIHEDCAQ